MSRRLWLWVAALLAFVAGSFAAVSCEEVESEGGSDEFTANISLGFSVPATLMTSHVLDMVPSEDNLGLHVRSIGGDVVSCTVMPSGDNVCESPTTRATTDPEKTAPSHGPVRPLPPTVDVSDRLVAVDGLPISIMSFQEVIDAPVGSSIILPLFKPARSANILAGFARVEIFNPTRLDFEPATDKRKQDILDYIEAEANYEVAKREWEEELARNQELREQIERERREFEDRERKMKELIEAHERAEFERLRMTPHVAVSRKRAEGWEFRYAVEFTEPGPIGINWHLHEPDKTVVSHLEPELPADQLNVMASGDQLIALNDVNTSTMGPYEMVEVYLQTKLPRTLVFLVAGKRSRLPDGNEPPPPPPRPQNWTLTFDSPSILRDWNVRLHLANWSAIPNENMTAKSKDVLPSELALANPNNACSTIRDVRSSRLSSSEANATAVTAYLAYRGTCSFFDKAQHVQAVGGHSMLVVNNVKGDGRFTPSPVPTSETSEIPVTLMSKLDGEIIISVLEYERANIRILEETPDQVPKPPVVPPPLTNAELTLGQDVSKSGRKLTLWSPALSQDSASRMEQFTVLPALFGGRIPSMPFRIVVAYPQETACDIKGMGILATRAVVLVKRGGCSFGKKIKVVQDAGGAGMLVANSDETLHPLMTDPKEVQDVTIWGATITYSDGVQIQRLLETNKNVPVLVRVERASSK